MFVKEFSETINILEEGFNDINEDDIIIQLTSSIIKTKYSQICKYSQVIREDYHLKDARDNLSEILLKYSKIYSIREKNIILFFNLINEQNIVITNTEFYDLFILSKLFKVICLEKILLKYVKKHSQDISFIVHLICESNSMKNEFSKEIVNEFIMNKSYNFDDKNEICAFLESILKDRIEECLTNEEFGKLPIPIIYQIIEQSPDKENYADLLYDFVNNSIEERYVLFSLIEVENLSQKKFNQAVDDYSKNKKASRNKYYQYLSIDLSFASKIKEESNREIEELKNEIENLKRKNEDLEMKNKQLSIDKNELMQKFDDIKKRSDQIETDKKRLLIDVQTLKEQNDYKTKQLIQAKNNIIVCDFTGNELSGIILYLQKQEMNILKVSNGGYQNRIHPIIYILNYDFYLNYSFMNFGSFPYRCCAKDDSWIEFDFTYTKINLTSYTIRSCAGNANCMCKPKSWKIVGSNDHNEWIDLDHQINRSELNGRFFQHHFECQKSENYYRYIRYIQEDTFCLPEKYNISLTCFELFGTVKLQ